MKLKYAAILSLFFFSAFACYADSKKGSEEIIQMVKAFNKRLEKTAPEDGFFIVIQDKDNDQINAFKISYFTLTIRDKKMEYRLDAAVDSGHFFASVEENGKVLKIVYNAYKTKVAYAVKMIGNSLQLFDENDKAIFPSPDNGATNAHAEDVRTAADVMPKPSFDLGAYLGDNLHYPENARLNNKEGKVLVRFVVDENGTISDAEVMKGFDDECDQEALRVVRNMPTWIPGKIDGKNVKVYFTLPMRFKLTN